MKKILFIVFSLLWTSSIQAQHPIFPFEKNQKWGIVDTTGKVIKKAKYDFIWFFLNPATDTAITIFKRKGKYGIISRTGKTIQKPVYDGLKFLRSGKYLQFKRAGKWGLYEYASKQEVLEAAYDEKFAFYDGSEKWVRINQHGKGGLWVNGKILIEPIYPIIGMSKRGACPELYAENDSMQFWFDCKGNLLKKEAKKPKVAEKPQPLEDIPDLGGLGGFSMPESIEIEKSPQEILQEKMGESIKILDLTIQNGKVLALAQAETGTGIIDYEGNVFLPLIYESLFFPNDKFPHAGHFPESRRYLFVRTKEGLGGYMSWESGQVYLPK